MYGKREQYMDVTFEHTISDKIRGPIGRKR